jgi:hypothetical protein
MPPISSSLPAVVAEFRITPAVPPAPAGLRQ